MAVLYQASGSIAASTGADVTPAWPTHVADDIGIAHVFYRSQSPTVATPSGWTLLSGPYDGGASTRHYWFWKRAAGASETNPLMDKSAATGDTYARIYTIRGAWTGGNPFEGIEPSSHDTSDPVSITGVTSLTANALIFGMVGEADDDANDFTVSATDPAAFSQDNELSTTGADGLMGRFNASRTAAGATGSISINWQTAPDGGATLVVAIGDSSAGASGILAATLQRALFSGTGMHAAGFVGSVASSLRSPTFSGSGATAPTGTMAARITPLTATIESVHVDPRQSVVELDLDGDGVFETDITGYVFSVESLTGRDRASQLTGKAGPGKLNVLVNNHDDRFSDFNESSPYYGLLVPGARIRWRDANTVADDPVVLVQDRFNRSAGALGTTENSLTWDNPGTALDPFEVTEQRAVPSIEGAENMSTVLIDTGSYYVQATLAQLGSDDNVVGLVYRWVSDNDYSLLVVDVAQARLRLIDVALGVQSVVAELGAEVYSGMTVGVLVAGTVETVYLEGVAYLGPVLTSHPDCEEVGMYAEWATGADRPAIDDFYVWDHLPEVTEGIFWTGRLTEPRPSVQVGTLKTATLEAIGPLAELARQAVTPPTSLVGKPTGLLMGNVLALSGHLRPPGPIDLGDITTGIFVTERWSYALNIARLIEETELGFLFETQEGYIGFRERSHNDSITQSAVTFSD
jgi:hypothetical protein